MLRLLKSSRGFFYHTKKLSAYEKSFTLPSKLARKFTGIVYGDGFSYSDNDGNIIASYSDDGNNWGTHQETLMIQNDALKNGLAKFGLKIFWLFCDYKEPSFKAREQHEKIIHSSDRTYLVWKEDNSFHYKILLPIEPSRTAENTEVYRAILRQFWKNTALSMKQTLERNNFIAF